MSVSDYVLHEAVGSSLADSVQFNDNMNDIEDTNVSAFNAAVISGGVISVSSGVTIAINASVYLIGIKLSKGATTLVLPDNTTSRVWAVTDPDNADRVVYQATSTATTLARACLLGEVTTLTGAITLIDQTAAKGVKYLVDLASAEEYVPKVTITVGAESANVIQVSVQFQSLGGVNLGVRHAAVMWLSDAANTAPTATAPDGGWAAGTGYKIKDETTSILGKFASDANGKARVDITHSGARTWYLHVLVGNRVYVSSAITFT